MKNSSSFEEVITGQRVVASLRRIDDLGEVLNHKKIQTIFILNTNIFELKRITSEVKKSEKKVFVHVDLVEGLGKDTTGIKFLAKAIGVDGIISTKSSLIKAANEEGLVTVQRFFMVDSEAVKTGIKIAKVGRPDALEILPAFLPKYYLDMIKEELGVPVIAGGLMRTEEDAKQVLGIGFRAITSSRRDLWELD